MHDPREGVSATGTIVTGADRSRISPGFRGLLDAAVADLTALDGSVDVYVYGSVAAGTAIPVASDVDLLTIGASPTDVAGIAATMSRRCAGRCRGVEIAAAQPDDYVPETDEAYGNRVFLRHYCVHLAGPQTIDVPTDFAADRIAARGFNGDIRRHLDRWNDDLAGGVDPAVLGRRLARKALLAVAGLVSVHDRTWTTDRTIAATRWARTRPNLAVGLDELLSWSDGTTAATRPQIHASLNGTIGAIVNSFATDIGLWA